MINILVKEEKQIETLREENAILKVVLKEYVKKSINYEELLQESLGLLDRYQEEVENLKLRANLWADEVVRQYFITEDLDKALNAVGREIMLYELSKNRKSEEE